MVAGLAVESVACRDFGLCGLCWCPTFSTMALPQDPGAFVAALEGLRPSFLALLRERTPFLWQPDYPRANSPHRFLDMVEMYSGTGRLSLACHQAGCVFSNMFSIKLISSFDGALRVEWWCRRST